MKKLKKLKKIAMLSTAFLMPITASGIALVSQPAQKVNADEAAANYHSGYMEEVSMSNNNFNSSSTYSISTSLSGWTGQNNDKKTTAGIINVGSSFQNYMTGTYRLAKNPLAKANDKNILMINSKTSDSSAYATARQGYKSSNITLDANSYYSFQVSFKSDTNYNSYTTYVEKSQTTEETTLDKTKFEAKAFGEHISFTYKSKAYYIEKTLEATGNTIASTVTDIDKANVYYEDEEYVGIVYEDNAIFLKKEFVEKQADEKYTIKANAETYVCKNISYDKDSSKYKVAANTKYYTAKTAYTSLNDYVFGSMYLSGLKDVDGNDVKAEFKEVSSKDWTTFYFFVETGSKSQTVSLDLWLGAKEAGHESSGTVFFDDCHIYKYSENTFLKTYKSFMGRSFTQEITSGSGTTEVEIPCTTLVRLDESKLLEYPSNNFDFEAGVYNDNISSLKNWKSSGSGNARVFDTRDAQYFKQQTGYAFTGSTLSCKVEIDGETIDLTPNNYALALWGNNETVKVTSNDIAIDANEIYKIKAYYKVSDLSSGNAYVFVEENNNVLEAYNLSADDYKVSAETASSALSSNSSDAFVNKYNVVEFFVKGGSLYNSSINLSLGLGKTDENATGCVIFDDITIEKASTSDFDNASNKVELDKISSTLTVANGNFNKVTIGSNDTHPYAPQNWTITNGNGTVFGGAINTESSTYAKYVAKYEEYKANGVEDYENPYIWATFANPKDSNGTTTNPDNILMLANMTNSWQTVTSENFNLEANKTYKLNFKFKTINLDTAEKATFKINIVDDNGITLFTSQELKSDSVWSGYDIYFKSFMNASNANIKIDFGTSTDTIRGFAYFDNFEFNTVTETVFENKASTAEGNGDIFGVVDMSNFYLNLPTNKKSDQDGNYNITTPAYTGTVSSGEQTNGGLVQSTKFANENSNFYIADASEDKSVFYIASENAGGYSIQSNYKIDLKSGSYYALSFKIKTYFGGELDAEKEYNYGATVGLTGFKYLTNLKTSNDIKDGYQTYTIYFNPSEDASTQLYIALVCDTKETAGAVAVYDIVLSESDEETFNMIKDKTEADGFNFDEEKVFVSTADTDDSTEEDTPSDDKTEEETPTSNANIDWSILAASLITGLAIIVAVIGYFLSKIKLKKVEKKKKESYDRKSSLNIDAIKVKARQQREQDLAEVQSTLAKFEKELENLEATHKQRVVEQRLKDKGKVSKETDKEFKLFAQKRTVVAEKIESLKKKIEEINSPEYALNLERKVYAQEEAKKKELIKASKARSKKTAK